MPHVHDNSNLDIQDVSDIILLDLNIVNCQCMHKASTSNYVSFPYLHDCMNVQVIWTVKFAIHFSPTVCQDTMKLLQLISGK